MMSVSRLVPLLACLFSIRQLQVNIFKWISALKRFPLKLSIQSCQSHKNIHKLSISMEYRSCQLQKCMQQFSFAINAYKSCYHYFCFLKHLIRCIKITKSNKMTMKDQIPNLANLKTKLVLKKTSTAHVEQHHGISKFMKTFRRAPWNMKIDENISNFFLDLLNQQKSHYPNQRMIK